MPMDMHCHCDCAHVSSCKYCTRSVWTVDLAHLMRHFGLDVTLATTVIGANPGYFREGFYMENMAEDQYRVTQLFKVRSL